MDEISEPSPLLLLARSSSKKKQVVPQTTIKDLITKIKVCYDNLQKKYEESSTQNQSYLLSIYLKVLNKMLDQVVYAQEKVRLLDNEGLKDQKCFAYLCKIAHYREECFQVKGQLEDRQALLNRERKRTEDLLSERDQIQDLCRKKDRDLQGMRMFLNTVRGQNKLTKRNINMKEIKQQKAHQEQNPETKPKNSINRSQNITVSPDMFHNISFTKNKQVNSEQRTPRTSKSVHLNIRQAKMLKNLSPNKQTNVQIGQDFAMDKLSTTLWLYQPSSYRRQKYTAGVPVRSIRAIANNPDRSEEEFAFQLEKQPHTSQQSTKKGSSVGQYNQ